jgi:hypothetical protein
MGRRQTEIPVLHDVEHNLLGALMQDPDLWDPTILEECSLAITNREAH